MLGNEGNNTMQTTEQAEREAQVEERNVELEEIAEEVREAKSELENAYEKLEAALDRAAEKLGARHNDEIESLRPDYAVPERLDNIADVVEGLTEF